MVTTSKAKISELHQISLSLKRLKKPTTCFDKTKA